jgi:hypothetical protein
MRWPALAGLLPLMLLAAIGCGGDGAGSHRDGGVDEVPCTPGQPFDLTGTFGVLTTLRESVEVLGLQLQDNAEAESILRVELVQTGTDVAMQSLMCSVEFPPIQLAGQENPTLFTLPTDVLKALDKVPGSATVSGTTTCSTYSTVIPIIVILGYRPAEPLATSPVPQDPDAQGCDGNSAISCDATTATACICDQEGDGYPGVSLLVQNPPVFNDLDLVYATLRVVVHLTGKVYSSDLYMGEVDNAMEQYVLGCHRASGNCSPSATDVMRNANPTITQDPTSPSVFISKRIDPSWDCARLLTERPNLFPK